jgi:integrase
MASYQRRKNSDGSRSVLALVRVRPFKSASKAFKNHADAKKWATDLEVELRKKREESDVRPDLTTLTLAQLIRTYLSDPETQALRHYEGRQLLLSWWINHYGAEKVREFGSMKLREARDSLRHGRKPATVNRYLGALRSCWSWGRAAQYIPAERVWPTRLFLTEPKERVRFLSDDELKAVLTEAEKYAPWMHTAIVVSLATGLRQGNVLNLEWKDLNFDKKTVTVLGKDTTGGGGKWLTVHLPDPAIVALKKIRVVGPKRVFTRPNGTPADKSFLTFHWNVVRKAAGLKDFRWHDLRHTCASFLAQNGASLLEIGSVLGHSSPAITAKYAHLVAGRPVTGADKLAEKLGAKL